MAALKVAFNCMTTKLIAASALAGVLLMGAPVAFAHDNGGRGEDKGLTIGQSIKAEIDLDHDGKVEKDEREEAKDTLRTHVTAGVVTSINGSTFVIDPKGKQATTTVTTNGSTIFTVKGVATSSSALKVGSKVFLVGTTTATSTVTGDSFTASFVNIMAKGFGHLRFWLWFHHDK